MSKPSVLMLETKEQLDSAKTKDRLITNFSKMIKSLGFSSCVLSTYINQSEILPTIFLDNKKTQDWAKKYVTQGYHRFDPIVQYGNKESEAFIWSELPGKHDLTRMNLAIMAEASDFGINNGITIPLIEDDGSHSMINYSLEDAAEAKYLEIVANEVEAISRHFLENYRKFEKPKKLIYPHGFEDLDDYVILSNREKECLAWAAHGKTAEEIEIILGIRARTVSHHWESVKRKLNVVNLKQAIAKAVAMKIIYI